MGSHDQAMRGEPAAQARDTLELALEAADVGVWEIDLPAQRMSISQGMARLLGHDAAPAPWTVRAFEEHVFPDDIEAFRLAFRQGLARGELRCEIRMRGPGGRLVWVALRGRAGAGEHGVATRLVGVALDISAPKASEQFVRERDADFSAMFDVSSVGMAHTDPSSGRLLRVNERLADMLGQKVRDLVGRRFVPLLHPEDRDAAWNGFLRLVSGDAHTLQTECRLMHRGRQTVWAWMTMNVIRDATGQPTRTVAVIVDITQRKLAEQALREREEDLSRARDELERRVAERTAELGQINAALEGEIAERRAAELRVRELLGRQVQAVEDERARISRELHDTLGQHLAALSIGLNALAQQAASGAPVHDRVAQAQQSLRIIEDELDRLSYELRPLALDDLGLGEALRTHAAQWSHETGVAVDVHTRGLRSGRLPALVETTVYRIVQEALTNVRKHARARRASVILERRADQLRLVVEDDGAGFDPGAVAPMRGRHLGLRGMSERARQVGGELEIESLPGRGTTLYLVVPLQGLRAGAEGR